MNKKQKGFSLIEILAAIVILGLLSTIAIVSVNYILQKAEQEYYEAQKDEIIAAAKSYTQDNRNALPKRVGMRTNIRLSTLQSKKYIGDVVDRHKGKCNADETIVQVYKYDKTHYSYSVILVCPNYAMERNAESDNAGNITFTYNNWPVSESKLDYSNITATINMKDEDKIASYNYIIYNNEIEVKNSGDVEGKLKTEIEKTVPLEKYLPGKITIKVIITDYYGNQTVETSDEMDIKSSKDPTCSALTGQKTEWTGRESIPIEISVKCTSQSNKGCEKDVYTQSYVSSVKIAYILMKDKENNLLQLQCPVNVYLDMEPPTTPVIINDHENTWTNLKDDDGNSFTYTIKIITKDETSGVKQLEYRYPNSTLTASDGKPENEWHVWENSGAEPNVELQFTSTPFTKERGEILEVRALDVAGNYSEISTTTIKIDKTKPEISNISNPYLNTWFNYAAYTKNNSAYVIKITSKDKTDNIATNETGISGIAYHSYKYASTSWTEYASSGIKNKEGAVNRDAYVFTTTPFTKDRDEKVYFQVCDNAGNCTEGESYIMLDKTLPTISISNPYAGKWYNNTDYKNNKTFNVSATAADETAYLAKFNYKYNDESSWTTKSFTHDSKTKSNTITPNGSPYKDEMNKTLTFEACDHAENCTTVSTNISIDYTLPTCSINLNPANPDGQNNWYVNNVTVTLTKYDNFSGVDCFGLGTSSSVSCNSVAAKTQYETTGTTWYGIVKDNAGNISKCNTNTLYVDTTAPVIRLS